MVAFVLPHSAARLGSDVGFALVGCWFGLVCSGLGFRVWVWLGLVWGVYLFAWLLFLLLGPWGWSCYFVVVSSHLVLYFPARHAYLWHPRLD
jgi:hypothetical protein